LLQDAAGNFYGTTADPGNGLIFRLNRNGSETVLYAFSGYPDDGAAPAAALVMDAARNLYGTTIQGGPSNLGTVFKLDSVGNETVLHSFTGGADGSSPGYGPLLLDSQGNLYGTTEEGGSGDGGTVFKLDSTGKETILYSFTGGTNGDKPAAGLIQDKAGNFYGTTWFGGAYYKGTVFKLTPQ
jgi:uncharacterized repeat protein (TIGR03803 family)